MDNRTPDVEIKIYISHVGIQADFLKEGQEHGSVCRDFKLDYEDRTPLIEELFIWLYTIIGAFIKVK